MIQIFKQKFSYKLDIYIHPNWNNLYKKLCNPKSEKKWEKSLKRKVEKIKKMDGSHNLGWRWYYFTEYYDSASGLVTKFQKVKNVITGEDHFCAVNEFGDGGYVFESDNKQKLSDEKYNARHRKLYVEIGENFIRNDIFDMHSYRKFEENYFFLFPLSYVFNFLFALGQRFPGKERNTVIKWPGIIEKELKEREIDYKTYFRCAPTLFDIEKHDKEFFIKWDKPKISLIESTKPEGGGFVTKDGIFYGVELKIFRTGENERIW